MPPESKQSPKQDAHIHEKVITFITNFRNGHNGQIGEKSPDWGALDVANQALDAMQSMITRQKLAAYPADYIIEIARNSCGILEFDRAREMIELGYKKAQLSLPEKEEQLD